MAGLIFTWSVFAVSCGCNDRSDARSSELKREEQSIKLADLPNRRQFKATPYLRASVLLQEMGKNKACEELIKLAKRDDEDGQVTILCRLLFSKKGNNQFRAPLIGNPLYMGGTGCNDWPLLPMEIVNQVPFFVVKGYEIGGWSEPSYLYLEYCMENCEWAKTRFCYGDGEAIQRALRKLLTSGKWIRPLTEYERELLISQTK